MARMIVGGEFIYTWGQMAMEHIVLLSAYVSNVERQLELGLDQFVSHRDTGKHGEGTPFEIEYEVLDGMSDHDWDVEGIYADTFPNLHRSSVFLTLCATFEHQLNVLCKHYQQERKLRVAFTDLKGRGVNRAEEYLTKVVGLTLDSRDSQATWKHLRDTYRVRNIIAHSDGRLEDRHMEERRVIERSRHLSLKGNEIRLSAGFLPDVLDRFRGVVLIIDQADRIWRSATRPQ